MMRALSSLKGFGQTLSYKNKTNHPVSSNSYPLATAKVFIVLLVRVQSQDMKGLFVYECRTKYIARYIQ